MVAPADKWSTWLLDRRYGGDAEHRLVVSRQIQRIRDRVLDGARLQNGMHLADIGTGDGLIAFGAIARIGASLRVSLQDSSAPLLEYARHRAADLRVLEQCSFESGTAERLEGIDDDAVDVVTTRAVLAYVARKTAALREFHRVLKPGGRISLAEPVFRDQVLETIDLTKHINSRTAPAESDFLQLTHIWKSAQFPSTKKEARKSPLANYTERDLVTFSRQAGFRNIHMELHIDTYPSSVKTWDVFLETSPHPWAPPLRDIFATRFSDRECQLFERVLRPLVESGKTTERDVVAYLTAEKQ